MLPFYKVGSDKLMSMINVDNKVVQNMEGIINKMI